MIFALRNQQSFDLLLLGHEDAHHLGVPVETLQRRMVVVTALAVGSAVAFTGIIGFVGLVVPHALRPFVGVEHRRLLPAAFVGGAVFVIWADVIVRLLPTQGHVPLGVVTGLVGAPIFLVLLSRASRQGRLA